MEIANKAFDAVNHKGFIILQFVYFGLSYLLVTFEQIEIPRAVISIQIIIRYHKTEKQCLQIVLSGSNFYSQHDIHHESPYFRKFVSK